LCSGRELEKDGGGSKRICGASLMSDGGSDLGEECERRQASGGSQQLWEEDKWELMQVWKGRTDSEAKERG